MDSPIEEPTLEMKLAVLDKMYAEATTAFQAWSGANESELATAYLNLALVTIRRRSHLADETVRFTVDVQLEVIPNASPTQTSV